MLMGLLATHDTEWGTFVDYVCVDKQSRRQGHARRLLSSLDAPVFLVTAALSTAYKAYLRLNFKPVHIGPYPTVGSEITMCSDQFPCEKAHVSALSAKEVSWDAIYAFLGKHGISRDSVDKLLRPDDPRMRYRVLYRPSTAVDAPTKKRILKRMRLEAEECSQNASLSEENETCVL